MNHSSSLKENAKKSEKLIVWHLRWAFNNIQLETKPHFCYNTMKQSGHGCMLASKAYRISLKPYTPEGVYDDCIIHNLLHMFASNPYGTKNKIETPWDIQMLGLWRKEAKREALRQRFNHRNSSIRQTRGKRGVSIHHKGCMNIW
jgi:hypothetical protein